MTAEIANLWKLLHDADYLYLVLQDLPLYGLGIGLIFLGVATAMGESRSRLVALVLMGASCATVGECVKMRQQATPRILEIYDKSFHTEIHAQTQRRVDSVWLFYGMAGLCIATIVFARGGRFGFLLILTVGCGFAMFVHSGWLHRKECEVFHPNIIHPGK
jgi:hypothetical protein